MRQRGLLCNRGYLSFRFLRPSNEKNIAYKCAKAFFNACDIENQGITIEIEKNIPMAAGTAGGSADGAGVLYCLNKIYKTNLVFNCDGSINNKQYAAKYFCSKRK